MDIGGVSGTGYNKINEVVANLNRTKEIVRDIFNELERFKNTVDEEIRKEIRKKIVEAVEKLLRMSSTMQVANLSTIRDVISDLRTSGLSPSEDHDLARLQKLIQQQIDDLKTRLQGV